MLEAYESASSRYPGRRNPGLLLVNRGVVHKQPKLGQSRAVFLDRDGVLNRAIVVDGRPLAPRTPDAFRLLPNTMKSVEALRQQGFKVVVVTNQPDVAKGLISREDLDWMNRRLMDSLQVEHVKVCAHGQDEGCGCRKPKPGMLLEAAVELNIALDRSYMVGDRWSDIEAGNRAGCYTIKIERGYVNDLPVEADYSVRSLAAAVKHILNKGRADAHD